jgi:ABC-2 type transport system ATP-binding protein
MQSHEAPQTDPAGEITIDVRELVKTYEGVNAVNGLTFTVRRGEIVGFLGPNGAGKSTTMRILTGFLPATSGHVSMCGIPVASRPDEVKRHIGYMPENNPLPEDMRVGEYLYYRGRLKEIGGRRLRERLEAVVERCDLKRVRHRMIGKLSKGFRQRVGIAEAILGEPDVLIMDEPTIGLDPHQIILIRDLISSLRGRMSVLISSHILPEIEMTCDRVIIINSGRIVASGTPRDLRNEYVGRTVYRLEANASAMRITEILDGVAPELKVSAAEGPDAEGFTAFTIGTPAAEDVGEALLLRLSAAGDVRVRMLGRERPTLEEVFLAATRRSWDLTLEKSGRPGTIR